MIFEGALNERLTEQKTTENGSLTYIESSETAVFCICTIF